MEKTTRPGALAGAAGAFGSAHACAGLTKIGETKGLGQRRRIGSDRSGLGGTSEARLVCFNLGGRWYGRYGLAYCPAHDNARTPALSVQDGVEGRLLVHCHAGCRARDVFAALRRLGLLQGDGDAFMPNLVVEAQRREGKVGDAARRTAQARRILSQTVPIAGTLAEAYLRKRAIRRALPSSLRYAPRCWHGGARKDFPALVAAVMRQDQVEPVAVHWTYLEQPGRKASVTPNKAMLGPVGGAAVRLCEGAGPLVVAEGIETALSLCDGLEGISLQVWAALSAAGMATLSLPLPPSELVIAPDPDSAGTRAAHKLGARAHSAGWRVRIMHPPESRDWNDLAQEGAL